MKELSIEGKAKLYDEALERANKLKETCDSNAVVGWMEYIFPELKESGDIRKRIIDALHGDVLEMSEIKDATTWLEKQGNLMKALQISNAKIGELIEKNYYLKEQLEKQGNNMGISEVTKQELEDNLNNALEQETPESCNEFLKKQGEQPKKHDVCDNCDQQGSCVSPCPMKLVEKQGEQKPKFRVGDTIKNKKTNKIFTISDYSLLYEYYHDINHYHEIKFSEQDDWELVEQKPTVEMKTPEESLGIDSDTYNKIVDECVYGKQKSAWSEEDIELLDNTIKFIEDRVAATSPSLRTYSPTLTGKEIPFLKSLKERVQPQPKQEWKPSDEQIKALEHFVRSVGESGYASPYDNNTKLLYSLLSDLKKLKS